MQGPGPQAVLSRRRDEPPCAACGTRGCGHDGRRAPRRSPDGSPCYGGTTRPARHRRARAGSRPAHGRSTGRRRRCTCTTGTAPPDQPPPPRAPPLRRHDGFLAFLVGLGDGPGVGHRHAAPTGGFRLVTWALFLFVTPRTPNLPGSPRRGPVRRRFPRILMVAYISRASSCSLFRTSKFLLWFTRSTPTKGKQTRFSLVLRTRTIFAISCIDRCSWGWCSAR